MREATDVDSIVVVVMCRPSVLAETTNDITYVRNAEIK